MSRPLHGDGRRRIRSLGSNRAHEYLVEAVLALCVLRGVPARAIHTGPRVTPREGGGYDLRANKRQWGVSDVIACRPPEGRLLMFECKTGGARLSAEQRDVRREFEEAGALVVEVRDIRDVEAVMPARRFTTQGGRHG